SADPPPGYRLMPVAGDLPIDALPNDVDPTSGRILLSSTTSGLFEVDWPSGAAAPTVRQHWPRQTFGMFGEARYAAGAIYANVYSAGLWKFVATNVSLIGPAAGLINTDLLTILVRSSGEVWVAGVPTPLGGGGIQVLRNDKPIQAILTQA